MSLESGYKARYIIHRPDGDFDAGEFETWEGGDLEPASGEHRNAQTRRSEARGGLRARSNLTLTRECTPEVWAQQAIWEDSAGRDRYTAVRQQVDGRGSPFGDPMTRTGIVGSPKWPNYDLNGGDNIGMFEIESGCDE